MTKRLFARSHAFETVQRREIHQDLIVPVESLDPPSEPPDNSKERAGWNENKPAEEKHTPGATSVGA